MGQRETSLRYTHLIGAIIVVIVVSLLSAHGALGAVQSVYTDDKNYYLNEVAVITVVADDGDVVSVQVWHKKGGSSTVVWNSPAYTVPASTLDGSTGEIVFHWNISLYNDGKGIYLIEVYIGGDPLHGVPTGKKVKVNVKDVKKGCEEPYIPFISSSTSDISSGDNAPESADDALSTPLGETVGSGNEGVDGSEVTGAENENGGVEKEAPPASVEDGTLVVHGKEVSPGGSHFQAFSLFVKRLLGIG